MLLKETVAVYCEYHTEHANTRTFGEQTTQFVPQGNTLRLHCKAVA
jgi:hypothetical protein